MSAHSGGSIPAKGFAIAVLVPVVLGSAITFFAAMSNWPREAFFSRETLHAALGGLAIGAVPTLLVALLMAWHGSSVGAAGNVAAPTAPLWGLITGGLVGFSLAWFLGFLVGLWFNDPLMGVYFGLWFGPFAGILSWETGFLTSRSHNSRSH